MVSDIHGIVAVEAAGAQIQAAAVTGLFDAFNTDIAQTVCTNKFGSFFNAHLIGDQFGFIINIRTEMTGVGKRGGGDAHMDLGGAGVAQHFYGAGRGGAADDGIVYYHQTLAADISFEGIELQTHSVVALSLGREDEAAANVAVFGKTGSQRNAAFKSIACGGVQSAVGHAADHVRFHGKFPCQLAAHVEVCLVDAEMINLRVAAGEINILKEAESGAVLFQNNGGFHRAIGFDDDHFARFDIPLKLKIGAVQCAGFAGYGYTMVAAAQAQRAHAKAVTHGNELVLAGKNDQGERAPQLADGVDDGLLNGIGVQGLVGNEGGDDLGVVGGGKIAAIRLQTLFDGAGVDDVAVVGGGQAAAEVLRDHGLNVLHAVGSGGGIAYMADGHVGLRQAAQHAFAEHFADQAKIFVIEDRTAVERGDACALLAAVLQGGQGIVGQARRFAVVDHGAEYAALFVQFVIKYHQKIPPF